MNNLKDENKNCFDIINNLKDLQNNRNKKLKYFTNILSKKIDLDKNYIINLELLKNDILKLIKNENTTLDKLIEIYLEDINIQINHFKNLNKNLENNFTNKIKPEIDNYFRFNYNLINNLEGIVNKLENYKNKFVNQIKNENDENNNDFFKICKKFKDKYIILDNNKNKIIKTIFKIDENLLNFFNKNKLELNIYCVDYIKNYEFEYQEIIKENNLIIYKDNNFYKNLTHFSLPYKILYNLIYKIITSENNLYNYLKIITENTNIIFFEFIINNNNIINYKYDLFKFLEENSFNFENVIKVNNNFKKCIYNILNKIIKYFKDLENYKEVIIIWFKIQNFNFINGFWKEFMFKYPLILDDKILKYLFIDFYTTKDSELKIEYILVNLISICDLYKFKYKNWIEKIVPDLKLNKNMDYFINLKNNMYKKYKIYLFNLNYFLKNYNIKLFGKLRSINQNINN